MPADVAVYATRILARGDLTPEAVRRMEEHVDRAVDELAATGVDVIAYCDMVTTFIMEAGLERIQGRGDREAHGGAGVVGMDRAARCAVRVERAPISRSARPIRARSMRSPPRSSPNAAMRSSDEATLDIVRMRDVPTVSENRLLAFVAGLRRDRAQAIVLLATDLPTFKSIATIEQTLGIPGADVEPDHPVARAAFQPNAMTPIPSLGRIFRDA